MVPLVLSVGGFLLPIWFVGKIVSDARLHGWDYIRQDSRIMYVDCAKSVASACAIGASLISLVVSTRGSASPGLLETVRYAVVLLIVGLIASIVTVVSLSRSYDRAMSRWLKDPARKPEDATDEGRLTAAELWWIVIPAAIGMIAFLEGFIFVARIAFVI
jgi:hypothetical protein